MLIQVALCLFPKCHLNRKSCIYAILKGLLNRSGHCMQYDVLHTVVGQYINACSGARPCQSRWQHCASGSPMCWDSHCCRHRHHHIIIIIINYYYHLLLLLLLTITIISSFFFLLVISTMENICIIFLNLKRLWSSGIAIIILFLHIKKLTCKTVIELSKTKLR